MEIEETVLLLSRNGESLKEFSTYLEGFGQPFSCARSCQEALQKLEEQEFRVLLMDENLPLIEGLELLGTLTSDSRLASTVCIRVPSLQHAQEKLKGLISVGRFPLSAALHDIIKALADP